MQFPNAIESPRDPRLASGIPYKCKHRAYYSGSPKERNEWKKWAKNGQCVTRKVPFGVAKKLRDDRWTSNLSSLVRRKYGSQEWLIGACDDSQSAHEFLPPTISDVFSEHTIPHYLVPVLAALASYACIV
ncbi:hypothetical protein RSAG8_05909, partial [Rhizoctonia solani AG-8 WAC10335]